jgi:hypothetical protein
MGAMIEAMLFGPWRLSRVKAHMGFMITRTLATVQE